MVHITGLKDRCAHLWWFEKGDRMWEGEGRKEGGDWQDEWITKAKIFPCKRDLIGEAVCIMEEFASG